MLEQEIVSHREPPPLFVYSGLYRPEIYNPISEELIDGNESASFFYIGNYERDHDYIGPVYIIRPSQASQPVIHFENRLIHQPTHPSVPSDFDFSQLVKELVKQSDKISNLTEFLKHFSLLHRFGQETIQNYWTILSKVLDQSQECLIEPVCFLEVEIESEDKEGNPIQRHVDIIGITHGGQVFIIEVASRYSEIFETYREKKYDQVKDNVDAFRKKFPSIPVVFGTCLFYEECENGDLYLSLRYPQLERAEE